MSSLATILACHFAILRNDHWVNHLVLGVSLLRATVSGRGIYRVASRISTIRGRARFTAAAVSGASLRT